MNKEDLLRSASQFNQLNILVIGDVILDAYYKGDVSRISPEAPVPVLDIKSKDYRLGGAANVGLNVNKLGAKIIL
jgi:bifunctional ADP-heptose synthase (sugar kinase/adenylyltransferase)